MAAAFGFLRQIKGQDVRLAGLNRRKPVVMPCAPLSHPAWQGLAAMQDARPGRAIGGSLRRKTQTQSRQFARKDGATPFRRRSVSVLTGPEIQGLSADEVALHPAPLCGSHPRQAWSTGTGQRPHRTAQCLIKKLAIGANAPDNQSLAGAAHPHLSVRPTPNLFRRETAQGGPAHRTSPIYANATKLNGTCDYTARRPICVLPAHSVLPASRPSKRIG